eukprot:TRINITY_DN4633_c0_g3_i1.p1 TRINITY_DN4633_c0_g3~~TRINITY_DN4633_c0_g3_i1.p1  ORF type:complete len:389 (-),score=90.49 TRINITY_DN4633_c0_g3_i1:240-1406(-)
MDVAMATLEALVSPFGVSQTTALGILLAGVFIALYMLTGQDDKGKQKKGIDPFTASPTATNGGARGGSAKGSKGSCKELYWQGYSDQFNDPPNEYGGFINGQNAETAWPFNNELASGSFLHLHRPTYDKELDKSGEYPYAWHLHGRKRLWEARVQFRFKREIENSKVRFGIELDDYVPIDRASAGLMKMTVAALRKVVGNSLYHSTGDAPGKGANGERERPVFVMPLWAFDQIIVTPEGEEPPDISHDIAEMGELRTKNKKEFIRKSTELRLVPGPTYTFSFWGISRFIDNLEWRIKNFMPMANVDSNKFAGSPPVHLVFYELSDAEGEERHVDSRKKYMFSVAFWSSKSPPKPERLKQLLPSTHEAVRAAEERGRRRSNFLTCCLGR